MLERIKELCKAQGKTLASLEKECGLGNGTISKWDKVSPSIDKVILISHALEVTVGEILGEKNPVPTNEDRQKAEFIDLWAHLSPEQKKRELAYLRELVNEQDK